MSYCQIVVGAPGSGKSTYCNGMQQFMKAIGREAIIVNMDPANEDLQYTPAVTVTDLITVEDVMREHSLGPNGALIFCMEWLDTNLSLLKDRLAPYADKYVLFDFPGQAELYTHNASLRSITSQIQSWGYLPVAVHLADAHLCTDPGNFVAGLMMSLSIMCHLELPHVNVLSKVDLVPTFGRLPFRLDYYTEVMDLGRLVKRIDPIFDFGEDGKVPGVDGGDSDDDDDDDGYDDDDDDEEEEDAEALASMSPTARAAAVAAAAASAKARRQQRAVKRYLRGHRRLSKAIAELVQDYALVSFRPLSVTDKEAMNRVLHAIDRANGYLFRGADLASVTGINVGVTAGDAFADYASPDAAMSLVNQFDSETGASAEVVTSEDVEIAAALAAKEAEEAARVAKKGGKEAADLVSRLGGLQIRSKNKGE